MTSTRGLTVVYLIDGLGTGGAERSLAELLPLLPSRGVEPGVVCLHHRDAGVERGVTSAGHDVTFLGSRTWVGRWFELRRLLRSRPPDVLHTTLFAADVLGRLAAVGLRTRVVTSLVNVTYEGGRLADPNVSRAKLAVVRQVDALTARRLTDHFHAITQAVKDSAVRTLGIAESDVTVVLRGRDVVRLGSPGPERRAAVRAALGIAPHELVLLAVGRQEFQKGHVDLLAAVALLASEGTDVTLVHAGRPGTASEAIQQEVRRAGIARRVHFLGHRDDVPDLMAAADVFVLPSRYEGLGGVLIEAMALGLPVVASDLPAVREVVADGHTALLYPVGSVPDLASVIGALARDPARRAELGRRGRSMFDARFDLGRSAEGMVAMYRAMTAESQP